MTKASSTGSGVSPCPRCGAQASGAFCSNCGAALSGASCRSCSAPLSSGARFCHRCGVPVSGSTAAGAVAGSDSRRDPLPWAVAAIALVALISLLAGGRFFGTRSGEGGGPRIVEQGGAAPGQPQRAPDLSQMTPRQMTDRLFNRVMQLHEQGKTDSARFLALNMAIPAFEFHDSLDADLRYDLGRIAEVSGELKLAKAQADTILQQKPTHLLGLVLSARVARLNGDSTGARNFDKRLIAASSAELALDLPEYQLHKLDLDSALARARRSGSE